jgi:ribosomal protein L37AE/L43A
MGNFEIAVKQLGLPACPQCGEIRRIDQIDDASWLCAVCRGTFHTAPTYPMAGPPTYRPATGLFRVLPR